jgi:hypothetical protein
MRLSECRPVVLIMMLAIPAGAVATSLPGIAQHASVAAVVLWLTGLGWGFHAMLHHRLAAEDRLAQLETKVALERDAHEALINVTRERALVIAAEWSRLQACLCNGERNNVPERMHALQAAIVMLQEAA